MKDLRKRANGLSVADASLVLIVWCEFYIGMIDINNNYSSSVVIHVVDDEHGVREALYRLLHRAGYAVQLHSSGEEYLNQYDGAPGCVILDLLMPRMDGETLLNEISQREHNVAVLVLTGNATIASTIRVMRAGAFDLLQKPFTTPELLAALSAVLEKARPLFAKRALAEEHRQRLAGLTPSERNVMDFIVAGLTSQEIANRLGNSKKTIDIHRSRVIQKMGVASTAELIKSCVALGVEKEN